MIEITWNIANLERETSDGFVYTAHYTVSATDGTYSSSLYGSVGFQRPETLIPFDDLTQDLVVEWVKEALGEERLEGINDALENQIDEQNQPTKLSGVPWN